MPPGTNNMEKRLVTHPILTVFEGEIAGNSCDIMQRVDVEDRVKYSSIHLP